MFDCYITFRSITYAQRGERLLEGTGIPHQLLRTPGALAVQGCGYALRIRRESLQAAAAVLRSAGIVFQRAYCMLGSGQYQEVPV